jgi:hypothetical protein
MMTFRPRKLQRAMCFGLLIFAETVVIPAASLSSDTILPVKYSPYPSNAKKPLTEVEKAAMSFGRQAISAVILQCDGKYLTISSLFGRSPAELKGPRVMISPTDLNLSAADRLNNVAWKGRATLLCEAARQHGAADWGPCPSGGVTWIEFQNKSGKWITDSVDGKRPQSCPGTSK